jgi:ferritin
MEEVTKIRQLIEHWMQHNNYHAKSYMEWAVKTADAGNENLSKILIRIALESKRMNRLFESAKKASS